jgi:hypothetical protein
MYVANVWWPRVGLATVRAELGCLHRLPCASTTGSMRTAPWLLLKLCLVFLLYLVAQRMESDSLFQMSKEKIPMIAFGTPFKVVIPPFEH